MRALLFLIGLIFGVGGLIARDILGQDIPAMKWVFGVLAFFCFLWSLFTKKAHAQRAQNSRSLMKIFSGMFLAFVALLLVNLIVQRLPWSWDLARGEENKLSELSIKTLQLIESPIEVVALAEDTFELNKALDLLALYARENANVRVNAIDKRYHPGYLQALRQEGRDLPKVVVKKPGLAAVLGQADELREGKITAAINSALRNRKEIIYLSEGHKEYTERGAPDESVALFVSKLQQDGFEVKKFQSQKGQAVPDDAAALLILGPASSFLEEEVALMKAYYEAGGSLLISVSASRTQAVANWVKLFGVEVRDDLVMDPTSAFNQPIMAMGQMLRSHPIGESLSGLVLIPVSASLKLGKGFQAILETHASSWGEKDYRILSQFDEGRDISGPLAVMASKDGPVAGKNRLIISGTSLFLTDRYINIGMNSDFSMSLVSWLVGRTENYLSIRPRKFESEKLEVWNQQVRKLLSWIYLLVIPGLFVVVSGFIFRLRSKL